MVDLVFYVVCGITMLQVMLSTGLLMSSVIPGQYPVLALPDEPWNGDRVSGVFSIRPPGPARAVS